MHLLNLCLLSAVVACGVGGVSGFRETEFRYKWVGVGGTIHDEVEDNSTHVEVSSTSDISDEAEDMGTLIVALMLENMPEHIFYELASRGSVGIFTKEDKTTIFPEYEHMRDRPECEGTCADECEDTCLPGIEYKWDDLPAIGGVTEEFPRATCVDDIIMCTEDDPYSGTYLALVHEFGHTVQGFGLRHVPGDWEDHILDSYNNAVENDIWNQGSSAMRDQNEYFAEGASVWFNVNHHPTASGGMSSCGKGIGEYCDTALDARAWLQEQDPGLHEVLSFTFSNYQDDLDTDMRICMSEGQGL